MSRDIRRHLCLLCLGGAFALACGGPAGPLVTDVLQLRAGDSLLDHLDAMKVTDHPASVLPADVQAQLSGHFTVQGITPSHVLVESVHADDWSALEDAEVAPLRERLGLDASTRAWSLRLDIDVETPLGRVWVGHEGRRLRPVRLTDTDFDRHWADDEAGALFAWKRTLGQLVGLCATRPGELRVGFDRATEPDLLLWETRLAGASAPRDAAELLHRVTLGREHRPALAVSAPARLALAVDDLQAEALELRVAAPALGVRHADGRLRPSASLSDGVTLAVELQFDGSPDEPVRVWESTLAPANAWVEAEVDLSAYVGRSFDLRLVTSGGPLGDTTCDYVLWGGLRLRGGVRRPPTRPHVILVDIDTLRADRLGIYGSRNDTSPLIDAWAEREGIVFDEARATSDWTLPATASMLTGLSVSQHGATRIGENLTAAHGSLALRLAAAGYETWARTDGGVVVPENGLAEGFDVFAENTGADGFAVGIDGLTEAMRTRRSERPLFLFLQTYAVHAPFAQDRRFVTGGTPTAGPLTEQPVTEQLVAGLLQVRGAPLGEAEAAHVSALYDAAVARMDAVIGHFLEGLHDTLDGEPYLVLLTSDHGEELLERGAFGHGHSLHRELLHVPLVLRLPAGPGGIRVGEPVSSLDLVPTLLAQVGLPVPPELPGRVLLQDERTPGPLVARHRDAGWSIEWNETKLLTGPIGREPFGARGRGVSGSPLRPDHPATFALYDLAQDPLEQSNLSESAPELAARLLERLERWRAQHQPLLAGGEGAPPLSLEQLEQLEQLGYLEGR